MSLGKARGGAGERGKKRDLRPGSQTLSWRVSSAAEAERPKTAKRVATREKSMLNLGYVIGRLKRALDQSREAQDN